MTDKDIKGTVASLLPNRGNSMNMNMLSEREKRLKEYADAEQQKLTAKEIANAKYREQRQLDTLEQKAKNPESLLTPVQKQRLDKKRKNIQLLEEIESKPVLAITEEALPLVGTSRREVARLLSSLNVNMNLNLTKTDTYNLLSCLLTCNEQQLNAIYENKKVPIAIKTVIKRLIADSKDGNISTIERLWDRVFGTANQATLQMPQQQQMFNGIIPNTVVSREAYTIIKDTIIGK